jgi:hypothetical protein
VAKPAELEETLGVKEELEVHVVVRVVATRAVAEETEAAAPRVVRA